MTRDEFISTALVYPNQINIWYSDASTAPPYYIYGVAIPTTNQNGQNILQLLQQSTQLTIELQDGITQTIQVSGGEIHQDTYGNEIYYLDVIPNYDITALAQSATFQTTIPIASILFSSTIDLLIFNASGFNPILNNVQNPRLSSYQIKQGTNIQAGIQDSTYSATGWINGRYEGSKTSQTTYLGISPTLAGKSFQGAYFPRTVTDAQIKGQVAANAVTYTTYLYIGEESVPTYTTIKDAYNIPALINGIAVGTITATGSEIPIALNGSLSTPIPKIGDIIQSSSLELMKIKAIDSYQNNGGYQQPLYKLTVERGYNYTPAGNIVTTTSPTIEPLVSLSTPMLLFKLEGNKVQGVQRGKVQVKSSGEILHIDRFGYTISGSF
jgi:hypothetical protein